MQQPPPTTTPTRTPRKSKRKKTAPAARRGAGDTPEPAAASAPAVLTSGTETAPEAPSPEGIQKLIDAIYRVLRSL